MKRALFALLFAALLLPALPHSASAASKLPKGVPAGSTQARVWGWIDGDKVKVRVGSTTEELLLIGADAPERKNGDGFAECFAADATTHIQKLLKKKQTVYLEQDRSDRDGKGRLLRYLWVPGEDGAKAFLLNTKMVRDGYAAFDAMAPDRKYDKNLKSAQKTAKSH